MTEPAEEYFVGRDPGEEAERFHSRPDGIFVAFHGIGATIFESQILIHVKEMRELGYKLDLWVFALSQETYTVSCSRSAELGQRYNVPIRIFRGVRPGLPLAEVLNACLFLRVLRRLKRRPQFVHARTDYSTLVCGLVRLLVPFELIWDCRGDAVAEFQMSRAGAGTRFKIGNYFKAKLTALHREAAKRLSTRAIFVSELLRSRCLPVTDCRLVKVIPSAASPERFYFDPHIRESGREKLGISPDQNLFIYSGSIAYYQCFEETVALFRRILKVEESAVLLLLTPDPSQAERLLLGFPKRSLRVLSAVMDDVNQFLNAADFAFFLRRRNSVNDVASPIKFAEYCLAGLPVIMTDAVVQSIEVARGLGNAIEVEVEGMPRSLERFSCRQRAELASRAKERLGRPSTLCMYAELYDVSSTGNS